MSIADKTKEYLGGVSAEAKRVSWPEKRVVWDSTLVDSWPEKRELWESTLVVVSFIFILAATTLVCDKVIEGFIRIVHAGA